MNMKHVQTQSSTERATAETDREEIWGMFKGPKVTISIHTTYRLANSVIQ